jgi:D-lactate dehydrogenase
MYMKILFYSSKDFEVPYINGANKTHMQVQFTSQQLSRETAHLARGFECISVFTADDASQEVIRLLQLEGVRYIAIRAAGYDNVDLSEAERVGIRVANVPGYSPYSIAEHAVAMILALDRKLVLAHQQVHAHNFTLENLVGFDLHQKTAGIIGTGKIGGIAARILHGFGCHLLGYDIEENDELKQDLNLRYCSLEELCRESDIITLHIPLNEKTRNLINKDLLSIMKKGVMIINTARGAVVNTQDILTFLQNKTIRAYGMDVYEKERGVFFFDHSEKHVNDPVLEQFLSMDNVLLTPHQGFATREALNNIADTTFYNILEWQSGLTPENELTSQHRLISAGDNKK